MRACFFFAQFSGGRNNGKLWRYYNEDLTASNQCHKRNAHTTSHQLTIQRWICTIGKAAKLCTRASWAKRAEDSARSLDTFSACSDSIFELRRNSRALAKNSTTSDEHRLKFPSKILSSSPSFLLEHTGYLLFLAAIFECKMFFRDCSCGPLENWQTLRADEVGSGENQSSQMSSEDDWNFGLPLFKHRSLFGQAHCAINRRTQRRIVCKTPSPECLPFYPNFLFPPREREIKDSYCTAMELPRQCVAKIHTGIEARMQTRKAYPWNKAVLFVMKFTAFSEVMEVICKTYVRTYKTSMTA